MIPLPQKTRKNGFNYIQVLRGDKSAVYSQWFGETLIAYEVMKIKIQPRRCIKGTWLEAREKFPHNEAFGYWAWTYRSLEKAMEKYKELSND